MSDDQDKLAEEWAAALGGDEDEGSDPVEDTMADMAADAGGGSDEALADEWAAALADTEQEEVRDEKEQQFLATQAHTAEFEDMTAEAKSGSNEGGKRDLDFILDIPLDVSAELGRTKLLINELLQLGQGSVVELNKLAGEPLEIYVNGKLVARGEAVVINEKFGIRLTDIISPIERVKQLG
ncbi:flagellar motor switch protein FliN [Pseudodesulfovibrio senegalensis]|uniref:Flagellar motor switch protein FliN n=1 Tax=Pseudodesulfovibrio senegalensis TaxID=1721087 RepID=A0A6N6MZ21_9BACT|nr:flagellar motor switch protein FliN [Pseudodesulfovibrio senegalensis]KAB1438994.1 flagellar motor switch protein FliN [Pseudodesulfovibrio senegalensis]